MPGNLAPVPAIWHRLAPCAKGLARRRSGDCRWGGARCGGDHQTGAGPRGEVDPEVRATDLPEGVMLTRVPLDGVTVSVALSAAAELPFESSQPARRIPDYRHQRNMPGWWWSSSTRSHVVYESWLERHQLSSWTVGDDTYRRSPVSLSEIGHLVTGRA